MRVQDFMDLDWHDSHVGYSLYIHHNKEFIRVSYIAIVNDGGVPKIALVTEDNFSPFPNGTNTLTPRDILDLNNFKNSQLVVVHDGKIYNLSEEFKVNGIDEEIAFETEKSLILEYDEEEKDF